MPDSGHIDQKSVAPHNHGIGAPVAQLDRARGFEPRGCRFESCRAHFSRESALRTKFYLDSAAATLLNPRYGTGESGARIWLPPMEQVGESLAALMVGKQKPVRFYQAVLRVLTRGGFFYIEAQLDDIVLFGETNARIGTCAAKLEKVFRRLM